MTEMKTWYIDGFGHFHNRQLEFHPGMNVIFGHNESGKSTLHAYMRYVLFGPDPVRSANKYEPLDGGKHGGRLVLSVDGEDLVVERYGKALKINASDVDADSRLLRALGRSDRSLFESVYGFDYEQMVEGSTLQGEQINARIFSASVRGGGAAASAVRAELSAAADRLLANRKATARINALIIEHEHVAKSLDTKRREIEGNARLYDEREQLVEARTTILAELDETRKSLASLETRSNAQEMRAELLSLRGNLAEMAPPIRTLVGFDVENRLELPLAHASKQHHRALLTHKAAQAKVEAIALDNPLWDCRDDIGRLHLHVDQVRENEVALQDAARQLENLCEEQRAELGSLPTAVAFQSVRVDPTLIERVRHAHQQWMSHIQTSRTSKTGLDSLSQKLSRTPVVERPAQTNSAVLKEMEELLVAREDLNTLDSNARIAQAKQATQQTPNISTAGVYRSVVLFAIGAVIVALGVGALISGWILLAGISALLGFLAIIFAIVNLRKSLSNPSEGLKNEDGDYERTQAAYRAAMESFNAAATNLGLSAPNMAEIRARLNALQSEQTELQRKATEYSHGMKARGDLEREIDDAKRQYQHANDEVAAAQNTWQQLVKAAGINIELTPEVVPSILETCLRAQVLERKIAQTQRDMDARRAEVVVFENEAKGALGSLVNPMQSVTIQVNTLKTRLVNETASREQYQNALQDLENAALEVSTEQHALSALESERNKVLEMANASDLLDLQQKVMGTNTYVANEEQAAELQRRLTSVLGYDLDEEAPSDWSNLASDKASCESNVLHLEGKLDMTRNRLAAVEATLGSVATNTDIQELEQRVEGIRRDLEVAVNRWCVLDGAETLVGESLRVFTDTHQPTVLKTASALISKATEGKYAEIRLADDGETILLVATRDKSMKEPKQLSKGTREALYFCIRLAFAMELAERTCPLPFAMDDVLLTTDDRRRRNLIQVLIEVAKKHQVIYFTCHEEIRALFAAHDETTLIDLEPTALAAAE